MTKATTNHYFNTGFPDDPILLDPNMVVRTDVESVSEIVHACLKPERTPLINSDLAKAIGIDSLWFKDERNRMDMGSFKAIGASYVLAREAAEKVGLEASDEELKSSLEGRIYATASAGTIFHWQMVPDYLELKQLFIYLKLFQLNLEILLKRMVQK